MGKLHELLAVEPDLKGAAEKILVETVNTFTKKEGHFKAQVRSYEPLDDEGLKLPEEKTEMVSTVKDKLQWTWTNFGKYIDAVAQKETTNTKASAYIEIDGVKVLEDPLPATLLLALEGRLRQVRSAYAAIPTLDPADHWEWDSQYKAYVTDAKESFKTKKVRKNHVLAEATDKHPAQVEVYTEDVIVGRWTTRKWSSMLTPAEKSDLMTRVDVLIRAVKQARQRANSCDVEKVSVSKKLFDFIHLK